MTTKELYQQVANNWFNRFYRFRAKGAEREFLDYEQEYMDYLIEKYRFYQAKADAEA